MAPTDDPTSPDGDGGSASAPNQKTLLGFPMWVVGVAALLVVAVLFIAWFSTSNAVTNKGNKYESGLNSQYLKNQESLSTCIVNSKQAVQVASAQTAAYDQVLTDVIKARTPQEQEVTEGRLFSGIVEAYPTQDPGPIYQDVLTIVTGCRDGYGALQRQLLQKLDIYTQWRTGSWTVRTFGGDFPSDNLIARVGTSKKTGDEALEAMYQIVQVQESIDGYTTGTIPVPELFPTTTVG